MVRYIEKKTDHQTPYRTVSWNTLSHCRQGSSRAIASGLLSAKARLDMTVCTTRRHLFAAGKFDRGATMSTVAVHAHRKQFGGTWAEAMSVCLTAAWRAAKLARHMAAH
ncbi:hypothetical protein FV228_16495 [Methylobacterium sp. WL18]|uniref:hypothetical protein n=1 Tax=Methylobacterium sp. WL18 TaxID=2603897 RepID=UPI0011C8890C|nr:hypothetical protein [Methylobacterium sp. WL18]TXN64701.1 hypothetical protein FV228_16495 [Methylobacterium sp. WL18]